MFTTQQVRQLLDRYRAGTCTQAERQLVERWYDELDRPTLLADSESERNRLLAQNYAALALKMNESSATARNRPRWQIGAVSVAASLVLMMGIGWYGWVQDTSPSAMPGGIVLTPSNEVTVNNTRLESLMVSLPDGSTVTLQPRSQLRYPRRFKAAQRTVTLVGEGFFAIQKNPAWPFFVNTNRLITRVLGTSFWVRAFPGQATAEVVVVSGRVAVYAGKSTNQRPATVLTPNQRATFYLTGDKLETSLAASPVPIEKKPPGELAVDDAAVADVLLQLSEIYGVPISYDKAALANCTVTARLTDKPLFTKLAQICASIGASYQVVGTRVIVQSNGCE